MKTKVKAFSVIFVLTGITLALIAHPHLPRTSKVGVGDGEAITLQHVTIPWNEANPDRLEKGSSWKPLGAKLNTPIALKSGSTSIPAGEYEVQITKHSAEKFSMALVQGSEVIELESEVTMGLPLQDHLVLDLHPRGAAGYIDLSFGAMRLSGKFEIAR